MRRRDIEKDKLVGSLSVIGHSAFHGVPRILERNKPNPLHDPPLVHIEARDDSFGEHFGVFSPSGG
jgi:hypothetical protein